MNLLMISGDRSLASGKQGAFYNTLSELHKHFDRIDIICPHVSVRRYYMTLFGNVYVHPSPWPLIFQPLWILHKGRKIVSSFHPSAAVVHEYPPFYNGFGARLLKGQVHILFLFELMHIPGLPRASGFKERIYYWLAKKFIAWDTIPAKAIRVINKHEVPDFLISVGVSREKIVYIPAFYMDLEIFQPSDTEKLFDVCFVGRMAKNKGLDIFLDVIERSGLVGVCVGDGPLLAWARKQAKKRKLKIHFPGFVKDSSEVATYLNRSKILLMPSLNEGGPRVILEAMACGVPVVATPVGMVPDVLPPECIEDWNPGDISVKIMNLLSDCELYERIKEEGLFTVRRFEKSAAIKEYADKIKDISS